MLVADALDAVAAEAVLQDGGALQGLAHGQLQGGIEVLQPVAGGEGAGGAGGEAGTGKVIAGALDGFKDVRQGVARHVVVPEGIAHLLELVEDHVLGVLLELVGLVEDLLDVGLAAGGGDDLAGDGAQPLKALLAHLGGEDGHALAGQELGVEGAAPAVVAGGGPDGLVIGGVKLAGDETGGKAAEGGAHLVAAGGEPLAHHGHDAAGHAGELRGELDVVGHGLIETAELLGLILPGDAEEVQGVDVPEADVFQLVLDLAGDGLGVLHLGDGGDDDVVLPGLLDVVLQAGLLDREIDHVSSFPPVCLDLMSI